MAKWKVNYIDEREPSIISDENLCLEYIISYVDVELNTHFSWIESIEDLDNNISYTQDMFCIYMASEYLITIYPELRDKIIEDISPIVYSLSEESSSEYKKASNVNLGANEKAKPSRFLRVISIIAIIISLIMFTNTHKKIYDFIMNVEEHRWGPLLY